MRRADYVEERPDDEQLPFDRLTPAASRRADGAAHRDLGSPMQFDEVIERLSSLADPEAAEGMARYGITPGKAYGVSIPELRKLAKEIGRDHKLAGQLWRAAYRETRILASMVDDPGAVTEAQMDRWVRRFDCWEVCDQVCMNLFEETRFAYDKCREWSDHEEEFVRRAGFVLMARLAVSDKEADDRRFEAFFPAMVRHADDERGMVKKAVNWALRQIGKRNVHLNAKAIEAAGAIKATGHRAGRWIAADALRELTSDAVQARLLTRRRQR